MLSDIFTFATIGDVFGLLAMIAGAIGSGTVIFNFTKKREDKRFAPLKRDVKKLELMVLINTQPGKAQIIENVYDEYIKLGGNSYITQVMKEWREDYEESIIKNRIRHKAGEE